MFLAGRDDGVFVKTVRPSVTGLFIGDRSMINGSVLW
jgi:hypothetical protein